MSQIALSPPATGTGVFTISAPATNTNQTLTLPDVTGTVLTTATAGVPVNGPAFNASTPNTKSAANATSTEMAGYSAPNFDTASCFNTTTGRFTPNVAGYYQFSWSIDFGVNGIGAASVVSAGLSKNGNGQWSAGVQTSGIAYCAVGSSAVIFMNGSTDFVSVYLFQNTSSTVSNFRALFAGALIRSAL